VQLDQSSDRGPGGLSPAAALERLVQAAAESGPSRRSLALGLALLAVAAVAGVLWWRSSAPELVPAVPLSLPMAGSGSVAGGSTTAPGGGPAGASSPDSPAGQPGPDDPVDAEPVEVVAHAAGAVVRPGVHRLPAGARVGDLVAAAGGAGPDADLDRLNLAAPVVDGSRVHVPRIGEDPPPEVVADVPPEAAGGPGGSTGPGSLVDLNTADAAGLDELPGVGPATADAILEHRARHGPFRAVDDLLAVTGIGPAKLERLRPLVRV
jgi:competence protein ComEA